MLTQGWTGFRTRFYIQYWIIVSFIAAFFPKENDKNVISTVKEDFGICYLTDSIEELDGLDDDGFEAPFS